MMQIHISHLRVAALGTLIACGVAVPAHANPALQFDADYIVDSAIVSGGADYQGSYLLSNLDLALTADLGALLGWSGATFHAALLDNLGGRPNDAAMTLQGVDNIEVSTPKFRLYEAWAEQQLGEKVSVRAGQYNLNSEFYANKAASLLLAPAFGIGSEMAATGPNGPSIFPLTALAVRVAASIGTTGYARAAVLNASVGVLGTGAALDFGNGALVIAEAGIAGTVTFAIGVWGYTQQQDEIHQPAAATTPLRTGAYGSYLLAQYPLGDPAAVRAAQLFVRTGLSDGKTTPFRGGWQAGLLVDRVFASRPASRMSLGINQAYLSSGYRLDLREQGVASVAAESAVELTFADELVPHLTLQPDAQIVLNAGGARDRAPVGILTLRVTLTK